MSTKLVEIHLLEFLYIQQVLDLIDFFLDCFVSLLFNGVVLGALGVDFEMEIYRIDMD